ncbi:MAG TPA: radical SAM protein [Chloroflexota bacterium]|nr:radical SAM protein [Chloroflexota bacterium]
MLQKEGAVPYALGIGLTNECNLSCAHCYRALGTPRLSMEDLQAACEHLEIGSVNLGTGENALHPQYHQMIAYLRARGIRLAITSNGYSVMAMSDAELQAFHTVELSLDFPTREEQDGFRGQGNWDLVLRCLDRCRDAGIRTSVIAVMMRTNWDRMAEIAQVAAAHGAMFRLNVYQPVTTDAFTMSYEQFWEGFRLLFARTRVIACSEPLVNAIMGLQTTHGSPCGTTSIRISPRREVTPCPYWPEKALALRDLAQQGGEVTNSPAFARTRVVPDACRGCRFVESCGGGCASRRALRGDLNAPDEYCPIIRGEEITLPFTLANPEDLPKVGNACSTAVVAVG